METLNLKPMSKGYKYKPADTTITVKLKGGASRSREDLVGATSIIPVSFMLDENDYSYLMAFYNTIGASQWFLCGLVTNTPDLRTHTCKFVGGSLSLDSVDGTSRFVVSANLEVMPLAVDPVFDALVLTFYEIYGSDYASLLARIAEFALVDMPTALGYE